MHMIQAADKAALLRVCWELGLPDDAAEGVFYAALELHNFELDKESRLKSVVRRSRELDEVASLAHRLNSAVQTLNIADLRRIDDEFKASPLRLHLDPPDPLETVFQHVAMSNVLRIGDVLLTLSSIARLMGKAMPDGSKGGRPSTQIVYADSVAKVARVVRLHGIKPGRNDDFVRLCEAVFEAAGVSVDPENAIRLFMRELAPFWTPLWDKLDKDLLSPEDQPAAESDTVKTPPKNGE